MKKTTSTLLLSLGLGLATLATPTQILAAKPNILVIWGDDIGQSNISAYTRGMMGYKTPNIDRIANEGILFTDSYGEQSCTAGRSTFILGQSVLRTGLSKVGLPGAKEGISEKDPTIAEMMKDQGYATGQFGKNHLGDRDEMLPSNHGFDEFFGNLYHLNAEEEPENVDYPKDPEFKKKYGPRGVIHSFADGKIEDTGPLTKKRMETIDDETVAAAIDFIERKTAEKKPWFVWWNATRMHHFTHIKKEHQGISGVNFYADGMVEHDRHVGKLLDTLDRLKIADNTFVYYSTDNGPQKNDWPDAGTSPFRSEKNTNWEGGWRVPTLAKWPGHIKPGSVSNGIVSGMDFYPTILAVAGKTDIKEDLLDGYKSKSNGKEYKVHLDGYNLLDHLEDPDKVPSPRKELFYFSDDGDLMAVRYGPWKMVFMEQRMQGTMKLWANPITKLRIPLILNLRRDPYEIAPVTSNVYNYWWIERSYLLVPVQDMVGKFLSTFKEYPPRMKAASFNLDQVIADMSKEENVKKD